MPRFHLFKHNGILIRVNYSSMGDPNTFSLEELPEALHQYSLETCLQLVGHDGGYVELEEQDFLRLCQLLKEHLPAVTSLVDYPSAVPTVDSRTAKVLECFPNLVKLELRDIYTSGGTLTFQAIGALKQLEEIIFNPSSGRNGWVMTPKCCEILANSLEGLPLLRKVEIESWIFSEPRECWWPLVCALGGKPNLDLDIERDGYQYIGDGTPAWQDGSWVEHVMDDDQWNILQNGLTWEQKLMEVQGRYNLNPPDGRNLKSILEDTNAAIPVVLISRWVEALVSLNARNQVDCVKAMKGKLSAIPEERVNDWILAMIEFHQQGQFVCFHMIFDIIKPKWISNHTYWESCR